MLPLIEPPFSPMISLAEGCVTDWPLEHRGLRGCRQFWEPGTRCSSGGRTNSTSILCPFGTLRLFALGAEANEYRIIALGRFWVSFGERSAKGSSRSVANAAIEEGAIARSSWKQLARQGISLPPGSEKPKPAAGGQLGGDKPPIQCFKCKEVGHVAANCPNK